GVAEPDGGGVVAGEPWPEGVEEEVLAVALPAAVAVVVAVVAAELVVDAVLALFFDEPPQATRSAAIIVIARNSENRFIESVEPFLLACQDADAEPSGSPPCPQTTRT
ncbi:MAG TPA: hypothetical protein VKU87_04580, partial [Thermomicrobiaceae bacterium]|nr:hypothetical protein [Thermomicrobiaceae bacterium]